jgi:hypothetical protein
MLLHARIAHHLAALAATALAACGLIAAVPASAGAAGGPAAVAHWAFDEGSGTTAADSADGHTATLTGGAGWGPVERDTSNGENQAGDGHPITLNGAVSAKGLGVHANGDVSVYLGGNCTRYTATVGVDDEVGGGGSVTFSVVADGRTLTTTPVLTGSSASVPIDVDVTGAQQLDLLIGDGGDGNGSDHGDWADARLVCA